MARVKVRAYKRRQNGKTIRVPRHSRNVKKRKARAELIRKRDGKEERLEMFLINTGTENLLAEIFTRGGEPVLGPDGKPVGGLMDITNAGKYELFDTQNPIRGLQQALDDEYLTNLQAGNPLRSGFGINTFDPLMKKLIKEDRSGRLDVNREILKKLNKKYPGFGLDPEDIENRNIPSSELLRGFVKRLQLRAADELTGSWDDIDRISKLPTESQKRAISKKGYGYSLEELPKDDLEVLQEFENSGLIDLSKAPESVSQRVDKKVKKEDEKKKRKGPFYQAKFFYPEGTLQTRADRMARQQQLEYNEFINKQKERILRPLRDHEKKKDYKVVKGTPDTSGKVTKETEKIIRQGSQGDVLSKSEREKLVKERAKIKKDVFKKLKEELPKIVKDAKKKFPNRVPTPSPAVEGRIVLPEFSDLGTIEGQRRAVDAIKRRAQQIAANSDFELVTEDMGTVEQKKFKQAQNVYLKRGKDTVINPSGTTSLQFKLSAIEEAKKLAEDKKKKAERAQKKASKTRKAAGEKKQPSVPSSAPINQVITTILQNLGGTTGSIKPTPKPVVKKKFKKGAKKKKATKKRSRKKK